MGLHMYGALIPSYMITHYSYVRVTERYMEPLDVKKMADLVMVHL